MRILAVDHGEKRIGLALSDTTATIATPLKVVEHTARAIDAAQVAARVPTAGTGRTGHRLTPGFRGSGRPQRSAAGHPALATSPTAINTDWQPTEPVITSADSFKQWYNTSAVNRAIPKQLALSELTPGTGLFGYDSTAFFPLSPSEGFGITPKGNDQGMNFLFTTEIHVQFKYTAGQKFTFRGDDDLWIFVNGQLALDLGSMHNAEEGTIDFDAQAAALNIAIGGTYSMDVFHAERHTRASNFRVTTNISCFTPGILK